jgi:beta-catenin-like protein 1
MARTRSIKVLDHALSTEAGRDACVRFIEALGLKTLFSALMRGSDSSQRKKSSRGATSAAEDDEHILGVLVSLFSNLDSDSAPRVRLLAKFVEDGYEKVDRLLELREAAEARVKGKEGELAAERRVRMLSKGPLRSRGAQRKSLQILQAEGLEFDKDDEYLARLDAGLFSLQMIDYILAWITMEDDGVRAALFWGCQWAILILRLFQIRDHIQMLLSRKDSSFRDVVAVLKEYGDNIGDGAVDAAVEGDEDQVTGSGAAQREIISQLIAYLESL